MTGTGISVEFRRLRQNHSVAVPERLDILSGQGFDGSRLLPDIGAPGGIGSVNGAHETDQGNNCHHRQSDAHCYLPSRDTVSVAGAA
jgi:hypothetical protein